MTTTIADNLTTIVPLEYQNAGGQPTHTPTGDTVTVQNDSAAIEAHVEEDGSGNRSLVLTPAQPPQNGAVATVTVTDVLSDGTTLTTPPEAFTVAAAANSAKSVVLRLDMITTRPLPSRGGARVVISR
jgi:hypothetical protein